jgi:hypothetical protein
MQPRSRQGRPPPRAAERGAAMVLFTIGMLVIIGMAGLALDSGHAMLNKTRLQNTVDAAALSAAKTLDETADVAVAEAAAFSMFAGNANSAGNYELAEQYAADGIDVTVEFSSTLDPFVPGSEPAAYVRVRAMDFTLPAWFIRVLGFEDKRVGASAVAGPSPTINSACNLMPMMVCGDPDAGAPFFGYTAHQPQVLKTSTTSGDWEVGPGNFQLIQLGGQGANVVRENMAGGYDGCMFDGDVVETAPGNQVGPVVQGLNTRFGDWMGPLAGMQATYPADVVTQQPVPPLTYDAETDTISQGAEVITSGDDIAFGGYQDYSDRVAEPNWDHQLAPEGYGALQRRELTVAIGDCSTTTNGQGQVDLLGFGCFFLLQQAEQKGNESHIYGEFLEDCRTGGMAGPEPTTIPGPYVIQLYRDFSSSDS